MVNNYELLLLIAAYLRKANHQEETDAQIMGGVRVDLAKIIRGVAAVEVANSFVPAETAAEHVASANGRAGAIEAGA